MTVFRRILRVVVGAAFVTAGVGKLADGGGPRVVPLIVGPEAGVLATVAAAFEDAIPLLELVAGLAAWVGIARVARTVLGVTLGSAFVAVALAMPQGIRCGCFGAFGGVESRAAHLAIAAVLTMSVGVLGWLDRRTTCAANSCPEAT